MAFLHSQKVLSFDLAGGQCGLTHYRRFGKRHQTLLEKLRFSVDDQMLIGIEKDIRNFKE